MLQDNIHFYFLLSFYFFTNSVSQAQTEGPFANAAKFPYCESLKDIQFPNDDCIRGKSFHPNDCGQWKLFISINDSKHLGTGKKRLPTPIFIYKDNSNLCMTAFRGGNNDGVELLYGTICSNKTFVCALDKTIKINELKTKTRPKVLGDLGQPIIKGGGDCAACHISPFIAVTTDLYEKFIRDSDIKAHNQAFGIRTLIWPNLEGPSTSEPFTLNTGVVLTSQKYTGCSGNTCHHSFPKRSIPILKQDLCGSVFGAAFTPDANLKGIDGEKIGGPITDFQGLNTAGAMYHVILKNKKYGFKNKIECYDFFKEQQCPIDEKIKNSVQDVCIRWGNHKGHIK